MVLYVLLDQCKFKGNKSIAIYFAFKLLNHCAKYQMTKYTEECKDSKVI